MTVVTGAQPELSIVIGVLNAVHHIEGCLERVYDQGLSQNEFEVLVLDGGSKDATREVIADFVRRHGVTNLSVIDNPRRTLAAAFNTALPHCRGAFVAKVDAQGRLGPNYYRTLLQELRDDPRIGLIGGGFHPEGKTPLAAAWARAFRDPVLVGPARYRYTTTRAEIDATTYGLYRREAMEQVGGFDERILRAEDTDFNLRMRRLGWKIVVQPCVSSTYYVRHDLASAYEQFEGYAYWRSFVRRKHGLPFGARQVAPLLWLAIMSGSLVLAATFGNWWLLTPVLLYLALVAARALRFARGGSLKHRLAVVLLYPTLHLAYAVGTLRATFRPRGWTRNVQSAGSPP